MSKELILQQIQKEPGSWTDLINLTQLSRATLYQHLQELQGKDLITKNEEGKYILTKEGQKYLKKHRLMQLFSEILGILLEEGQK